jgi:hypothetical protein
MSIWTTDDPTGTRASDGESEHDDGPYVCPGCYAVGGEPCAPRCIDVEIERDRERDR